MEMQPTKVKKSGNIWGDFLPASAHSERRLSSPAIAHSERRLSSPAVAHSERRLVTGLAKAAWIARCATVIQAIPIELNIARMNMDALRGILYV